MGIIIPNGDFEGGGSWVFTGNAGIQGFPSAIPGIVQAPHDGLNFGYIETMTTTSTVTGTMTVDFTVSPGFAGSYRLAGWVAYNHYPLHLFGDGAQFLWVYVDGTPWINGVNVALSGYQVWQALLSAPSFLSVGTHTLHIVGGSNPFLDFTGSPWDNMRTYLLFDTLSFSGGPLIPLLPLIRLTHHSGPNRIHFSVPHGGTGRLVHHS